MDYNELKISDTKHSAKKKIIAALIVLAVIVTIGAIVSLSIAHKQSKLEEESNALKSGTAGLSGDYTFFVTGTDDDKTNVNFALLIRAQLFNSSFTVTPIDLNAIVPDSTLTLSQYYKNGGAVEMANAAEKLKNVSIDRYVRFTRSGLTMIFGELGHIELDIKNPITLKVAEGEVSIPAGVQELDYEELCDYLLSLCSDKNNLQFFGDTVCEIIKQYIENTNYSDIDSKFNSIINYTETDITASDFFAAKDTIKAFENTSFSFKTVL